MHLHLKFRHFLVSNIRSIFNSSQAQSPPQSPTPEEMLPPPPPKPTFAKISLPKSVVIKSYNTSPSAGDTSLKRSNKLPKGKLSKVSAACSERGNTPSTLDNATPAGGDAPLKGQNTTSKDGATKKTDTTSSKQPAVQSDCRNPKTNSILSCQLTKPNTSAAHKRLPKLAVVQPTNRLKRLMPPKITTVSMLPKVATVSKLPTVTTVPKLIPVTNQKIVKLFQNVKLPLANIKVPTSRLSALNDASKAALGSGATAPVVVKPHNSRLVYVRSKDGKKILIGK